MSVGASELEYSEVAAVSPPSTYGVEVAVYACRLFNANDRREFRRKSALRMRLLESQIPRTEAPVCSYCYLP